MDLTGRRITEEALQRLAGWAVNGNQVVYRGRLYILTDYDADDRSYLLSSPSQEGSSPDEH